MPEPRMLQKYRDKAEQDVLPKIVPRRFNPSGEAWLPVLHKERSPWQFTALFSNTARAHELGRTRDWVVIYFHTDSEPEGQRTIVTETRGTLIASRVVRLAHRVGVPEPVLSLLLASGADIASLLTDSRLAGISFTGSTATARTIQRALAERNGGFIPLIAETGGLNAMIVDSSAQPDQVVRDVIESAFDSAGQRCSALRILFVQDDIADAILDPLKGAMAMLTLGHPAALDTDIGPVISAARARELEAYLEAFPTAAVTRSPVSGAEYGHYVAPAVIELDDLTMPEREGRQAHA